VAVSIRQLLLLAGASAALTVLGILLLDAPAARALAELDPAWAPVRALDVVLEWLDRLTFVDLPRGRLATILIVAGGLLWFVRRGIGGALLLFGLTHAISRVGGSYLKELFGRIRPPEAIARGDLDHTFFEGGHAFPSGHIGHHAAIFLVVAILWPRARVPAFVVIGLVALARLAHNAHWISDLTAGLTLAALGAAASAAMLRAAGTRRASGRSSA
jgi:membrane-associated phospholipid phosphatase